jgi:hypothetical protein
MIRTDALQCTSLFSHPLNPGVTPSTNAGKNLCSLDF